MAYVCGYAYIWLFFRKIKQSIKFKLNSIKIKNISNKTVLCANLSM